MRNVGVLGAGTMGAQIAAHLANAGVPVVLLDIDPKVAKEGLDRARKLKPDPFFTPAAASLITTGGFDTDLAKLKDCDWVLEAVVERLDVKQQLLAKVEAVVGPQCILSSNTSGIPIAAIAEGRSAGFKKRWLGTHFFNPPRYLKLLEIIPTPDTAPDVVAKISRFGDLRLGKGIVIAKDTPNFIANHLGMYGIVRIMEALATGSYTVEEIDAMTGPAIGRPKSATFRTVDIAGVDVLHHVLRNLGERPGADEATQKAFAMPPLIAELVKRGWVGEKTGQGFYKRVKGAEGKSEIQALDPSTMEYRPQKKAKFPSIEAGKSIENTGERIKTLFLGKDKVGEFLRQTLGAALIYSAKVAPEISHSIDDVDRAMRWGFGWEIGPFETWDAIGVKEVLEACQVTEVPVLVQQVLDKGANRFREGALPAQAPEFVMLKAAKDARKIVKKNAGASLVDIGDGVLCLEFHTKMNAIGADTVQMMMAGVKEAEQNFQAMVVGNDAQNFSAGANLMLLLLEAQEGNWDEVDLMIRAFQNATMALRYANVPVVVAPAGLTLGGGCETALHGARQQAAGETYMGLVEVGVGLIPAGGGTKEMIARAVEGVTSLNTDLLPMIQKAFEPIAFGTVATSAGEARRLGFIRPIDRVSMNRDRLIADAKDLALSLAREGYQRPAPRTQIAVGGESVLGALKIGIHIAWRGGRISDHDKLIGTKLATIMAGGALPHPAFVTEQHLLDLEREAFLSLCGQQKTLERIKHMLTTGKPLRN
jgi:3-hydroxyacyl-CoA dehydrogenase